MSEYYCSLQTVERTWTDSFSNGIGFPVKADSPEEAAIQYALIHYCPATTVRVYNTGTKGFSYFKVKVVAIPTK